MGMREEFEAWHVMNCSPVCPHAGSEYRAWVASRATLVIELPEFDEPAYHSPGSPNQHSANGYNQGVEATREAIHAAGVHTK